MLEALASASRMLLLRDIPVYDPWLVNGENCYKGSSVDEFVDLLDKILKHEVKDLRENGQLTAQRRSIEDIGIQLKRVYERVLKM